MGIFLSVTALAIAFAGGVGILLFLAPSTLRQSSAGFFGTAMVVGAGMLSLLSFILGFWVQGALLKWTVTACCVVPLVLGSIRCLRQPWKMRWPKIGVLQALMITLVVGQVRFVTWLSLHKADLGWDGLFLWEAKAHIAFRHNGALPLPFYTSGYPVTAPEYPVFLPQLQVWIYEWLGHIDQSLVKLIGPYLYLAAMLMLMSSVQGITKKSKTAIIPLLLLPAVPQLMVGYGSVSTGYADFPLAVVWLGAVVHAIEFCNTGSSSAARLTGMCAMFLAFVKNDGFVALVCIALTVAPKLVKNRNWKAGVWMLAPGFAVWLGWHIFLRVCHVARSSYLLPVNWATLVTHLNRIGTIAYWTIQELIAWDRWGILWIATLAAAVFLATQRKRINSYPLVVNALLPLILYPCVFLFSAYGQVEVHMAVALSRLLIHNGLNAVLLVSTALAILFVGPDIPASARSGEAWAQ